MFDGRIPKLEQLSLAETAFKATWKRLELAAGFVVGAAFGAIEGGQQGLQSVRDEQQHKADSMAAIEEFANGSERSGD